MTVKFPKNFYFLLLILLTNSLFSKAIAQVAISTDNTKADSSAMLDIKSINKGVLVPRVTSTQRIFIVKPADGLIVYDTDTKSFWYYKNGFGWTKIEGEPYWLPNTNGIYYNSGSVGIGTSATDTYVPLTVYANRTNNTGNAVLHLKSDDLWHSALSIFNGTREYSFILAGPSNGNSVPGTFGLFNHTASSWSFNFNPITNNMAIGSTSFNSNTPKSKLHVFNGDVNIDQIGSGIIMKSPDGNCWRVTVDNTGKLVPTAITCP